MVLANIVVFLLQCVANFFVLLGVYLLTVVAVPPLGIPMALATFVFCGTFSTTWPGFFEIWLGGIMLVAVIGTTFRRLAGDHWRLFSQ